MSSSQAPTSALVGDSAPSLSSSIRFLDSTVHFLAIHRDARGKDELRDYVPHGLVDVHEPVSESSGWGLKMDGGTETAGAGLDEP